MFFAISWFETLANPIEALTFASPGPGLELNKITHLFVSSYRGQPLAPGEPVRAELLREVLLREIAVAEFFPKSDLVRVAVVQLRAGGQHHLAPEVGFGAGIRSLVHENGIKR